MTGRKEVLKLVTDAIDELIEAELERRLRERIARVLGAEPARKARKARKKRGPKPKAKTAAKIVKRRARRVKRVYSLEVKQKAVALAKKTSPSEAARELKINPKSIYYWMQGKGLEPMQAAA